MILKLKLYVTFTFTYTFWIFTDNYYSQKYVHIYVVPIFLKFTHTVVADKLIFKKVLVVYDLRPCIHCIQSNVLRLTIKLTYLNTK